MMCVCGTCKVCRHRATNARSRARQRAIRIAKRERRLPVGPLLAIATLPELREATNSRIYQWRDRGWVSERQADEAAINLRLHPSLVWDEWFADA